MTEDERDDMDSIFCGLVDRTKYIMLNFQRGRLSEALIVKDFRHRRKKV